MKYHLFWNSHKPFERDKEDVLKKRIDLTLQNGYFHTVVNKESLNWKQLEINIIFTDDREITELNEKFRNKNKPTDILTFPFELPENKMDHPDTGELYISLDTAKKNSVMHKNSLLDEISLLFIHGLLHAFHFDHEVNEEEKTIMETHEKTLLSQTNLEHIIPLTSYGS
ncbi:MAG: rRNA maturation RNase YbeY [Leptospirales bacterium]